MDVGLTVTDRVTYHGLQWFNRVGVTSNATVQDFLDYVGCALWRVLLGV
jgi:glycosylphosphatidylinositol transamidase (GPIT) subunit GPI8